jgi:hypothetical protein
MAKPHILFSCSELVTHIFTFLDYKDILHMQSVCKVFHAATADPALDDHLFRTARPGDENRLVESITDINKVRLHPIFSHLSWFDKLQCIVVLADSRRSITRSRLGALKESITVPPVKTLNMAWQDPRAENCRGVCTIRNDTGVTLKQYLKELEERLKGPLYDEDPAEIVGRFDEIWRCQRTAYETICVVLSPCSTCSVLGTILRRAMEGWKWNGTSPLRGTRNPLASRLPMIV